MVRNIPHLAMIPLVILWFGIGEAAKLFLVAVGVLFRSTSTPSTASATVDRGLIEMARTYGLSAAHSSAVILPGALPSILVGLRYALGIMWLTLIVAETIAATSGIGYMTMNAREFLQTDVVLLGVMVYALLGKLADSATRLLERRCLAWHPATQAGGAQHERHAGLSTPGGQGAAGCCPPAIGTGWRCSSPTLEEVRRAASAGRARPRYPTWRVRGDHRPLGLRQEHPPAAAGRPSMCPMPASCCSTASLSRACRCRCGCCSRMHGGALAGRPGECRHARGEDWRERAQDALADVGLADRRASGRPCSRAASASGVALARAPVSRPRLLLLDEPFGALDALTRRDMHELLSRIWQRDGFTTVLITHDVAEAVMLADRVLVLREGRFVLDVEVDVSRPRELGDKHLVQLERRILAAV